jgi:hypothetical protein
VAADGRAGAGDLLEDGPARRPEAVDLGRVDRVG